MQERVSTGADPEAPGRRPRPSRAAVVAIMKANRRVDTGPEVRLRSALHARGLRFRKDHRIDLDDGGRPIRADVAFPRRRVAVFVDGCFWHRCPQHCVLPKANDHYWGPKLRRNAERDAQQGARLEVAGWLVLRLWEHVPLAEAATRVEEAVRARPPAR